MKTNFKIEVTKCTKYNLNTRRIDLLQQKIKGINYELIQRVSGKLHLKFTDLRLFMRRFSGLTFPRRVSSTILPFTEWLMNDTFITKLRELFSHVSQSFTVDGIDRPWVNFKQKKSFILNFGYSYSSQYFRLLTALWKKMQKTNFKTPYTLIQAIGAEWFNVIMIIGDVISEAICALKTIVSTVRGRI